MLGNPFACAVDWATMSKTDLENTYWGWDPNLSSTGGYVTVSTLGDVTLVSPYTGSTGLNQYIQSGQGFFVRTSGSSQSLLSGNRIRFPTLTAMLSALPMAAISIPAGDQPALPQQWGYGFSRRRSGCL